MAFRFLSPIGKDLLVPGTSGQSVMRQKNLKSIGSPSADSFIVHLNRVIEPLETLMLRVEHMGYQSAGHNFVIGMAAGGKERLHSVSLSDDDENDEMTGKEVRILVKGCAQGSLVRMERADAMVQIRIDDRIFAFMDLSELPAPVSKFFIQMVGDVKELRIVDPASSAQQHGPVPICFMVPDYPIHAKIGHQKKMVTIPVSSAVPDQIPVYLNRDMAVGEKLVLQIDVHKGQQGAFAFGLTTCNTALIRSLPCHESGDCARNRCTRKQDKYRAKVVKAGISLKFSTSLLIERKKDELVLSTVYKRKSYPLWTILKNADLTPFILIPKCVSHVTIPADQITAAQPFEPKAQPKKKRNRTISLPSKLIDDPFELTDLPVVGSRVLNKSQQLLIDLCVDRDVKTRTRHRRYTECVVAATSHRFL